MYNIPPPPVPGLYAPERCREFAERIAGMEQFLKPTEVIDWIHPAVSSQARELAKNTTGALETAQRCFTWVRDSIQHSSDFRRNPVTCAASAVLTSGTGYCYAK